MTQTRTGSNLIWNIVSYAVLIGLALLSIGPLLWMLLTSLKVEDDIVTRTMVYLPTRFTFENYTKLWNTMAMLRSLGCTSLTLRSPIRMSPPELGSSPAMIDKSVDFPQPDGPSSTRKPPSSTSMSILFSTSTAPKLLRTPLIDRVAIGTNP